MNEAEQQPTPEARNEIEGRPRIYVASLSDYNNGILHGRWIEAVDDPEAMQDEIDAMRHVATRLDDVSRLTQAIRTGEGALTNNEWWA